MEPGTIVEHHAEEILLVLSVRTGDAAAVFAADVHRVGESHFGYTGAAQAVRVVVFHQDAVVLVNAFHPRPVDRSTRAYVRSGGSVGITPGLGLAKGVHGACPRAAIGLTA